MLDIIHKGVLNKLSKYFNTFVQKSENRKLSTRNTKHERPIVVIKNRKYFDIQRKKRYETNMNNNRLPKNIVNKKHVKLFQRHLQLLLKHQMLSEHLN